MSLAPPLLNGRCTPLLRVPSLVYHTKNHHRISWLHKLYPCTRRAEKTSSQCSDSCLFTRATLCIARSCAVVRRLSVRPLHAGSVGATENAGVENVIRAKLQGWKMQDWKMREQTAGVENAGVSRMERQPEIIF